MPMRLFIWVWRPMMHIQYLKMTSKLLKRPKIGVNSPNGYGIEAKIGTKDFEFE